jgi:hypothetical protein
VASRVGNYSPSGFNSVNSGSDLNNDPKYDFLKIFFDYFESHNDDDDNFNDNPYTLNNISFKYFYELEFIRSFSEGNPIF